jgi:transposase-like protein
MSKRRTQSPEFKARVAMEAISGRKTLQEIAVDQAIHPIQLTQWKKQLLESSSWGTDASWSLSTGTITLWSAQVLKQFHETAEC